MSFHGTHWFSSAYFILLRVFHFFLFLCFVLFFVWILLLAQILKKVLSLRSEVPRWSFERWFALVLFGTQCNWFGSVWEKFKLYPSSTWLLDYFYISLIVAYSLDVLKNSLKKKETRIKKEIVEVLQQEVAIERAQENKDWEIEILAFDLIFVG